MLNHNYCQPSTRSNLQPTINHPERKNKQRIRQIRKEDVTSSKRLRYLPVNIRLVLGEVRCQHLHLLFWYLNVTAVLYAFIRFKCRLPRKWMNFELVRSKVLTNMMCQPVFAFYQELFSPSRCPTIRHSESIHSCL
jgi:hypothetical protein